MVYHSLHKMGKEFREGLAYGEICGFKYILSSLHTLTVNLWYFITYIMGERSLGRA